MSEGILGGGKRKKSTASKKKGGDFLTGATAAGLILAAEELYRASLKKHNMKGGNDEQLALLNGGKKQRKSSRRRGGKVDDNGNEVSDNDAAPVEPPAPPIEPPAPPVETEAPAQADDAQAEEVPELSREDAMNIVTENMKNLDLTTLRLAAKNSTDIIKQQSAGKRRKSSRARRGGDCGVSRQVTGGIFGGVRGGNALNNNVQALFAEAGQATGGIAAPAPAMGGKRRYKRRGGNDGSVGAGNHSSAEPSGLNGSPTGGNPPPPAPQVMQPPPMQPSAVNAGPPPEHASVAPVPPTVPGGGKHRKGRPCEHTKGKRHHSPAHRRGRPCHSGGSLATDATLETSFSSLLEQKVEAGEQGKVGGTHHRKGRPCEHTKGKRHHSPAHRRGRPCHSGGMAAIDQVAGLAGQVKGGLNAIY